MNPENGAPTWLALDGAANCRIVVPGVLLRADNLQSLSPDDVHRLVSDQALRVVLDLRTDVEVELEGPGPLTGEPAVRIEHRSLHPDAGQPADLEAGTAKPWRRIDDGRWADEPPLVPSYMSYLERRPDSIVGAMRAVARADGAVLVHCAAGKDRTGVVVALALDAVGAARGAIVTDYLASAERIEEIVGRLMSSPTYRAEFEGTDIARQTPVPGTIERVLEIVDSNWGGSADWLTAHGFGERDLERLRERLAPARAAQSLRR